MTTPLAPSPPSPILSCLEDLHRRHAGDFSGAVATYIPQLALANPGHFGIALVTPDGEVYETGDSRQEFTIQSISKPFVYGLALQDQGRDKVFDRVGVEPSGDPFNSIVFDERTNRPFNPMVNAGAIATTALITGGSFDERLHRIVTMFERFAGRALTIDESVYGSEKETGHRNRAIAYLELNAGMIEGPVEEHLDLYFRQCSIRVTARDLAVMAATLANRGTNPLTGEQALAPEHVRSMLSVMQSCGMYDFSGEWGFRVGLPAKSGVGGGIVAVLPGQFGVGTFSPPLDTQGNSARGIRVCEDLSRLFSLHMFDVDRASHSAIRVSYDGTRVRSKRTRAEDERAILAEEGGCIRAFELQGALTFASMEHISRSVLAEACDCRFLVLDGRRVTRIDPSARSLLLTLMAQLSLDDKRVLLSGFALDLQATIADQMEWPEDCFIDSLDRALEYCEDRVIRADIPEAWEGVLPLERTEIASGLTPGELEVLGGLISERRYSAGDLIIREGDEADALFVLASGSAAATVRVGASGRLRRLGAIGPGVLFGEVALLSGGRRTADVTAEQDCICYVAAIEDILTLQTDHPAIGLKLLLNLGRTLSERLRLANDEIRALEA